MATSQASTLKDMTEESIIHGNISMSLSVCPSHLCQFVDYEAKEKLHGETYKAYLERKFEASFAPAAWKKIAGFAEKVMEQTSIPRNTDISALNSLFYAFFNVQDKTDVCCSPVRVSQTQDSVVIRSVRVQTDTVPGLLRTDNISEAATAEHPFENNGTKLKKRSPPKNKTVRNFTEKPNATEAECDEEKDVRDVAVQVRDVSKFLDEIGAVRFVRNEVMHNFQSTKDPGKMFELQDALIKFMSYAGSFYLISDVDIQSKIRNVKSEVSKISLIKSDPYYKYARLIVRGREAAKIYFNSQFSTEVLLFQNTVVERAHVYYSLQLRAMQGDTNRLFSLGEVLNFSEEVVIVSGVAGAGKTTLLKNTILQFFNLQLEASSVFSCFHSLVYIDCSDTAKNLSEILEQQLKDVFQELGAQAIFEALRDLRILILIDGFDDTNSRSLGIIQDLLKKFRPFKGQTVVTTRPHEVRRLSRLLSKNDITSTEYVIEPITQLERQLHFLRRYEQSLCGTHSIELTESFANLSSHLRAMFTEPLNLLLFCHSFRRLPGRIAKWESYADVARDIFSLYKDLIEQKLCDTMYNNMDLIVECCLVVVGKLALEHLQSDTQIFTEADHVQYQRELLNELQQYNVYEFNSSVVLSVILKMKRPSARNQLVTYSFHHKALQELFAAKYLVNVIKTKPKHLKQILSPTGEENFTIIRVLTHVILDLSTSSAQHLRSSWPQLWDAMRDAGADYWICRELLPTIRNEPLAIKCVAETMQAQESEWELLLGADVAAVALMLPYAQPRVLKVSKNARLHDLEGNDWDIVIQRRVGNLSLRFSMNNDVACDKLLMPLSGSRCRLQNFSGYIADPASVEALASVAYTATNLCIGLLNPLSLQKLQGKYKYLRVVTEPFAATEGNIPAVPLPSDPPPVLEVGPLHRRSWNSVNRTIFALAPVDKRYGRIHLPGSLSGHELGLLVVALQRRGVRSGSLGLTKWKRNEYSITLHITDTLPAHFELLDEL